MNSILGLSGSNRPVEEQKNGAKPSQGGKSYLIVVLLVVQCLGGALGYYFLRKNMAEKDDLNRTQFKILTDRADAADERYQQQTGALNNKLEVLADTLKLTKQEVARRAALIQKQQEEEAARLKDELAKKASSEELSKTQADANAKFGVVSGDINGLNEKLGETNKALLGAKGELGGAIARTHDELVALAHRTDRDYFEFSLPRKKARQKVGTVTVELLKTDAKKNLFTVNLYFDDKRTMRKDKAANEPVYFYVQGASSALELVVNKVGKDSISGYMSAPKGFLQNTPNVLAARPEN